MANEEPNTIDKLIAVSQETGRLRLANEVLEWHKRFINSMSQQASEELITLIQRDKK